ncbi:MAG: helix-turn-helix transcriptional regulator [Ruminococcaceae bacterium]|nr:helix-turn-helix transcriptional regulator [Oscillospiraceae bacterium]
MNETMGQIIRRLRKEKNLTQEELAMQLNVTNQAVSKWENGDCIPDISQIVPLSNVFSVTTDVLFGIQTLDRDEEIRKIIENASAPQRLHYETEEEEFQASVKEYETYIEALKTYPNSISLLYAALSSGHNLAGDYAGRGDKERAAELRRECIRQGNVILNTCTDITCLMDTHRWLVWTYCDMGEYDKAEEHAKKMPRGFDNESGMMISWIKRAANDIEGELNQRCNTLARIISTLEFEIIPLGNDYYQKQQYEDAIRVYKVLYDLIPVIFGNEEYTPPYHGLTVGEKIALCCIKLGQNDEAIEWLWKDFVHLSKNAKHYNKYEHIETPLLRECTFRFFGEYLNIKGHMDYLNRPEFEMLHDHPRWEELVEKGLYNKSWGQIRCPAKKG